MRKSSILLAAVASTVIAISCAPAWAQTETDDGDEIVVTANKRTENINKVGLSITAVSADTLAQRRVTSLEDIASMALLQKS